MTPVAFTESGNYKCLNASALKLIAMLTMLTDHIGAGILLILIREKLYPFGLSRENAITLYYAIRHIGRQAFPIYCYLLVTGFTYTRNLRKYMLNMGIFGIISELFFDLALRVNVDTGSLNIPLVLSENRERVMAICNVYFTLLLGLIVMACMKYVEDRFFEKDETYFLGYTAKSPFAVILYILPAALIGALAYFVHTDYNAWGICLITIFYVFRKKPLIALAAGYLFFMNMPGEAWSLPAFILLLLYNGEQGELSKKYKYAFYAFYPVHLLLIYLARCLIMSGMS